MTRQDEILKKANITIRESMPEEHRLQVQKAQERGIIQANIMARENLPAAQKEQLQMLMAEKELIRALIAAKGSI